MIYTAAKNTSSLLPRDEKEDRRESSYMKCYYILDAKDGLLGAGRNMHRSRALDKAGTNSWYRYQGRRRRVSWGLVPRRKCKWGGASAFGVVGHTKWGGGEGRGERGVSVVYEGGKVEKVGRGVKQTFWPWGRGCLRFKFPGTRVPEAEPSEIHQQTATGRSQAQGPTAKQRDYGHRPQWKGRGRMAQRGTAVRLRRAARGGAAGWRIALKGRVQLPLSAAERTSALRGRQTPSQQGGACTIVLSGLPAAPPLPQNPYPSAMQRQRTGDTKWHPLISAEPYERALGAPLGRGPLRTEPQAKGSSITEISQPGETT
ncbi:hypothetical protein BDZ91DRAFT_765043 [Kalaharituber pfeilii]|nr:hypothetical protein BDZ91DRAFT_765043 [Kalaharituber pfeilii]